MRRPLALLLLSTTAAYAQTQGYEDRLEAWGLAQLGRDREPSPEGLRIEEIQIVSEDIIAPSDPYPALFNLFHVRTREEVVRRELRLARGEPYRAELAEESERNLRKLYILAIARVIPVRGRHGGVGVLVVTKDRWSLRLNSEFNLVGPLLQYLRLRPTEMNLLGLNQQLLVDLALRLDTLAIGQLYQNQRVGGTALSFGQTASVVLNRQTGAPEGWLGAVAFGRPLRTLEDTWGFSLTADWSVRTRRIFRGASVWQLPYPDEHHPTALVPYVYNQRVLNWEGGYTRSWGRSFKLDLIGGVGGYLRQFAPPVSAALPSDQQAWLQAHYLPRTESASYLTASVRAYRADYRVLRDIDTFELSEDYQFGPSLVVEGRWAHPAFLLPERYLEVGASLRYRWFILGDLLTVSLAGAARYENHHLRWVNRRWVAELLNVSPPILGGRLVTRGVVELHAEDLDNARQLLGGGNGLRGAPPESLSGPNVALVNLEYRSRSFELFTLFLGGVLFYDAGSAFEQSMAVTHTAGVGLRILVPQWNQETIRIDFGMVLNGPSPISVDRFSASYGQVTDYRSALFTRPLY